MSDRFTFRPGSGGADPWFRIGSLDVGTTMLITLSAIVSFFLYAVSPTLVGYLALWPGGILSGYAWQIVTWPLANAPGFWSALSIFFFWYFGTELESRVGKQKFAWLIGLTTVAMSVITIVLGLTAGSGVRPLLGGLGALQMVVILIFIVENLHARFMFGIPAWLLGLVILLLPILQMLGERMWLELLNMLLGLGAAAAIAKGQGLLTDYAFVPTVPTPKRRPPRGRRPERRGHPSEYSTPTVIEGPWLSSGAAGSPQAELDSLLDKISEGGIDSLTTKERRRLDELRRMLRGE